MKIRTTIALMLVMMATLVACSAAGTTASATQAAASGSTTSGTQSVAASTGTLSAITHLAVGTLNLEGTDQAVTAEQAKALLPLWQAYRALEQSDTSAPAELEALTNQIRETMSEAQLQAIDKMHLKVGDLGALMEKLGLRPALAADATPGARAFGNGEFGQGFPGGAPPAGAPGAGGFPGDGSGGSARQFSGGFSGAGGQGFIQVTPNATYQAGRAGRAGDRTAVLFINSLITLLQSRMGGS